MQKKTTKKIILWAEVVMFVLLIMLMGGSYYFLRYSLDNSNRERSEKAEWETFLKWYPELTNWVDSIRREPLKTKWITNADGDSLKVYYLSASRPTAKTVVLAHGYTDCAINMMHIGYMYNHDLGYNVVSYDQYAHGESAGETIQMGWKDRKNLIQCARVAEKMYGDSIVFHGISMGGATVMMASGDEELPEYVRAIVDDCGYTSVWDEFSGQLDSQFGLPEFPLMYTTSWLCKLLYGWSFSEASALDMVSKTKTPMLFIHGGNDAYVPTEMVHTLYNACHSHKSLWIAPGSKHADSYKDHPEEYTEKVRTFLTQAL